MALPPRTGGVQWPAVIAAVAAAGLLATWVADAAAAHGVALFGVGLALGVTLYQASFGFTSTLRVFLSEGQGAGLRAQLVMLAVACTLFFPALAAGSVFGNPVSGSVAPLNTSLAVGAFLFGIGMQLGGGCASGTLFAIGGGSSAMVLTLLFFVVGSVTGVAHLPFWTALPGLPAVALVESLGWPAALIANLAMFGLLWLAVAGIERQRFGSLKPINSGGYLLRGPWSLAAGAAALAVLNFATLALAGRPWGITSAFGLWGAKLLALCNIDLTSWDGWATLAQRAALAVPVLADITSVMDFGIMPGALLAAGLAGGFVLFQHLSSAGHRHR